MKFKILANIYIYCPSFLGAICAIHLISNTLGFEVCMHIWYVTETNTHSLTHSVTLNTNYYYYYFFLTPIIRTTIYKNDTKLHSYISRTWSWIHNLKNWHNKTSFNQVLYVYQNLAHIYTTLQENSDILREKIVGMSSE